MDFIETTSTARIFRRMRVGGAGHAKGAIAQERPHPAQENRPNDCRFSTKQTRPLRITVCVKDLAVVQVYHRGVLVAELSRQPLGNGPLHSVAVQIGERRLCGHNLRRRGESRKPVETGSKRKHGHVNQA